MWVCCGDSPPVKAKNKIEGDEKEGRVEMGNNCDFHKVELLMRIMLMV